MHASWPWNYLDLSEVEEMMPGEYVLTQNLIIILFLFAHFGSSNRFSTEGCHYRSALPINSTALKTLIVQQITNIILPSTSSNICHQPAMTASLQRQTLLFTIIFEHRPSTNAIQRAIL